MKRPSFNTGHAGAATVALAVLVACGGGGGGGNNEPPPPPTLNISSTALVSGVISVPYNQTVRVTGGTGARTFSVNDGALPDGLELDASTGVISGTPLGPVATAEFTIAVEDSGNPAQTDSQELGITINATSVGRNDTIETATALGNGTFSASISPSGDPSSVLDADEDYYQITTTATSTISVNIDAEAIGSPLDSVIELVGEDGTRLETCFSPVFEDECVNDDQSNNNLDSFLEVEVGGATVFYVHVVDFGSNARPDKLYDITISGVN